MTGNIDNWAKPRRFFSFRADIFCAIVLINHLHISKFSSCYIRGRNIYCLTNVFDTIIEDFGRNLTKCIEQWNYHVCSTLCWPCFSRQICGWKNQFQFRFFLQQKMECPSYVRCHNIIDHCRAIVWFCLPPRGSLSLRQALHRSRIPRPSGQREESGPAVPIGGLRKSGISDPGAKAWLSVYV